MFVHKDYNHLFGNLIAIADMGESVFQEFGGVGFYVTFLGGGVAALLPSTLLDNKQFRMTAFENKYNVPGFVTKNVMKVLDVVTSSLPNIHCGSSGAACALLGCNLVLYTRDIVTLCTQEGEDNNRRADRKRSVFKPMKVLRLLSSLTYGITYLSSEYDNLFSPLYSANTSLLEDFSNFLPEKVKVDHAGHLKGALFGMGFALTFGIIYPNVVKRFRKGLNDV